MISVALDAAVNPRARIEAVFATTEFGRRRISAALDAAVNPRASSNAASATTEFGRRRVSGEYGSSLLRSTFGREARDYGCRVIEKTARKKEELMILELKPMKLPSKSTSHLFSEGT